MEDVKRKVRKRDAALSRDQIVTAAVELLDRDGEAGLTFKTLAARLATGPGAIYGHIVGKSDLLSAAAGEIVAQVQKVRATRASPQDSIKSFALGIFDAIDAHPWLGAALTQAPGQPPLLQIFDAVGQDVRALGLPREKEWASTMAVFNYIVGVSSQNAANAQLARERAWDRAEVMASLARTWADLDPVKYPFAHSVGGQFRTHDDRSDFLAGIDFIIIGMTATIGPR